jgi:hypothetical protein
VLNNSKHSERKDKNMNQIDLDKNMIDLISESFFTNSNDILKIRLSAGIPNRCANNFGNENAPISAKYDCRLKVQYQKS